MSQITDLFAAVGLLYEESSRGNKITLTPVKHGRCPRVVVEQRSADFWFVSIDYQVDGRQMIHLVGRSANTKAKAISNVLVEIQFRLGLISEDDYKWHGFPRRCAA